MIDNNRWMSILRCSRAMTLLEIMLALLVLAMVFSMVAVSLSGSLRVIEATREQGEIYFRAQVALQRISEDLASALLVDGFDFIGENTEIDGRPAAALFFTSTAHVVFDPRYDHPGIAHISYKMVPGEDDGDGMVLVREDRLLGTTAMPESGSEVPVIGYLLSDRLRSVRCTYFDEIGEEHETWSTVAEDQDDPSRRKLPVAVQCSLDFWVDRENETSLEFTTKILILAGLINAENA
ncbi:MAG TPA: type II secretion system protein [Desulfobacteraceae bacterium]|nr:type II secretion system protein [Desulfobacteraceae bacterium]